MADNADAADSLGAKPEPHTEEPEHFPGGVDSVVDEESYGEIPDRPMIPDVPPETVSEVEEIPDALKTDDPPHEGDDEGPSGEAEQAAAEQADRESPA